MNEKARILVPLDGSNCSLNALDVAASLARQVSAELVLCYVADPARVAVLSGGQSQLIGGCYEEVEFEGQQVLDEAAKQVGPSASVTTRLCNGMPVDEIVRIAAELSASFIVMGTHGRTGLKHLFMGSVAEGVVRAARVPVMVVPVAYRSSEEIAGAAAQVIKKAGAA